MRLAKIIDHDVKCGEEGVHIKHKSTVPFPSGMVSKPTLVRGHLPLKSSKDNSHQAFKEVLSAGSLDEAEGADPPDVSEEDRINAEVERVMKTRGRLPNVSFFTFTATPRAKTLEIFGTPR